MARFRHLPQVVRLPGTILLLFLLVLFPGCGRRSSHQVISSSMSPALDGPLQVVLCTHCNQPRYLAADTANRQLPTRCFVCGGTCQFTEELIPGQKVEMVALEAGESINRLDMIVLSTENGQLVKRVWGLPGDEVTIELGELRLDDQLFQKDMAQFLKIAVPVAGLNEIRGSQWELGSRSADNQRHVTYTRLEERFGGGSIFLRRGDNLTYTHAVPAAVHPEQVTSEQWLAPSILNDDYQLNQGLSYQLRSVTDYGVVIELESLPVAAKLRLTLTHQGQPLVLILDSRHHISRSQAQSWDWSTGPLQLALERSCQVAVCDGRLLFTSEGQQLQLKLPTATDAGFSPESPLLALEPMQGSVTLKRCTVLRDLFLRVSLQDRRSAQSSWQVPADHYFVLGDNLPASIDSRNGLGFVGRKQIQGLVLPTSR